MVKNIYLDESGDTGWKFDAPYGNGGSSRYLTIAYLITPRDARHFPKRLLRSTYRKFSFTPSDEIKGSDLTDDQKAFFCSKVVNLLQNNPDIKIGAITVKKENVMNHIRTDSNKLYNYMINLGLLKRVANCTVVNLIRDDRSIKVKSGNSLIDYLQTQMWFEYEAQTKLIDFPSDSKKTMNIQFIDWISNIVWRHHELNDSENYRSLSGSIYTNNLFF